MCINTSDFFHAFPSYPREARSSGIACAPGSPPPRRRRPGAQRGAKPPPAAEARSRAPLRARGAPSRRRTEGWGWGWGSGPGPGPPRAQGFGERGGAGVQPSLALVYGGGFTAPGGYPALRFPRGQFAAPKRSSGFEPNTANKISMTLITPRMNISFT